MEAAVAQGRVAMMINGPWAWVNLRRVGVDFGIAKIPAVAGRPAAPFVGVKGVLISRATRQREVAVEFVKNHLLAPHGLRAIDRAEPIGAPASSAYFQELRADPVVGPRIAGIMDSAQDGLPTPSNPEMSRFWSAMKTSLTNLSEGRQTPAQGPDGQPILPDLPVLRWLWNSVVVALLSGIVTLLFSTTAAYALARLRFRGRRQLLTGLMLMQMFPAVLALVAIYAIFDRLGGVFPGIGLNTPWALVLAYSGGIAGHVWTLKGYYDTLPVEIEEAARVDGATAWQTFWRVLLPMALPILVVVFMLAFIGAIIEYPVASVLLNEQHKLTLAVGSKLFVQEHNFRWGDFAAAALLSGAPITAVFLLAQRWMISGLAAGGVKG